jgi:hypothetical protein
LATLLSQAKATTKTRNEKITKEKCGREQELMDFDIDLPFLIELLQAQQFRCAYSQIPLQFQCCEGVSEPLYAMSLERLNPWRGYVKTNVCLIAAGYQSCDWTRTRRFAVDGPSAWSKDKVAYVLQWLEERNRGLTTPSMTYQQFCRQQRPQAASS